jgi:predicted PurR-regulated permease PerM
MAAVLATSLSPLHRRLTRALGGMRQLSAVLLTLMVMALIGVPLGVVLGVLVHQALGGVTLAQHALGISSVAQFTPEALPPVVRERLSQALALFHISREQLGSLFAQATQWVERFAPSALEASGGLLVHSVVTLLGLFFFLIKGSSILDWLKGITPLAEEQTQELIDEFRKVSRAALVGTLFTAGIQGTLSAAGYIVFRLPEPLFLGLLTAMAAFIPVAGTSLVWAPAVLILWIAGSHAAAIGLLAWCLVFVLGVEHVAKPLILRGQVEMHMGLIFLSLLGGITMFGLIGILAGPVIVAFFLAMTRMYSRDMKQGRGSNPGRPAV